MVPHRKSAPTHATAHSRGELTLSGSGRQGQTSMRSLASLSPTMSHCPNTSAKVTCRLRHAAFAAHTYLYYFPMNKQDTRREAGLPPPSTVNAEQPHPGPRHRLARPHAPAQKPKLSALAGLNRWVLPGSPAHLLVRGDVGQQNKILAANSH